MIKCPRCHSAYADNTLFCDECATYLPEGDKEETDPRGQDLRRTIAASIGDISLAIAKRQTGPLSIRFKIENGLREIEAPLNKVLHLGRLDPVSDNFPEIDLTDAGALEKGVSRRHAKILKQDNTLIIEDLGSINGTYINGQKLAPYSAETIQDGDLLQLGHLIIQVKIHV